MRILLKIILIAVIPGILLGFIVLQKSPLYDRLLGLSHVDFALRERFLTHYGEPGQNILGRYTQADEFEAVWSLIKSYSPVTLRPQEPYWISRIGVENGSYVTLPRRGRVVLIPDSVPVIALYCTNLPAGCSGAEVIVVGTIGDLRRWARERRYYVRLLVDVVVILLSITIGLVLETGSAKHVKAGA